MIVICWLPTSGILSKKGLILNQLPAVDVLAVNL